MDILQSFPLIQHRDGINTKEKDSNTWWKAAVIYQMYPRSFQDTNNDGIGDLAGITQRLDYIAWLGIDAIWLSPVYSSPMKDFGYDIKDYRAIDPIFGTMDDFDLLLQKAHSLGIRVLMDMVMNHTSSEHIWFKESASSRNNPKRDYYIWRDPVQGKAPNNWLSAFGGKAWSFDDTTGQFYLHSFLQEQPDLNWRNPEVVRTMFAEIAFWLDKGVDGFRLDVINMIVKDENFRNNPYHLNRRPRPYDLQVHVYDRNRPEVHTVLKEFRSLLESYPGSILVGEIDCEAPGEPEKSAAYLGTGEDELHLAFDFSSMWLTWKAKAFNRVMKNWYRAIPEKGWPCWVLSNHDRKRAISRFHNNNKRAKLAALFLLTQRGTPVMYYGEELGMKEGKLPRAAIQDPPGKKYWPFYSGRDGCRLPMRWTSDSKEHFGFSHADPWLPVSASPNTPEDCVEAELQNSESLLLWYQQVLAYRKEHKACQYGTILLPVIPHKKVVWYVRMYAGEVVVILLNFSKRRQTVDLSRYLQTVSSALPAVLQISLQSGLHVAFYERENGSCTLEGDSGAVLDALLERI